MRTLATILLAAAVFPAWADAETKETSGKKRTDLFGTIDYKACEAKPRWLLVTVVEREVLTEDDEGKFKRSDWLTNSEEREELLDRCEISLIDEGRGEVANSSAKVTKSSPGFLTYLYVKESLQDICSVLPDCADATSLEDRP